MRLVVLAHSLRSGGGVSVGKNILRALSVVGNYHDYFVTVPKNCGYEHSCKMFNSLQLLEYSGKGSFLRRIFYEYLYLPLHVRKFNPDVVISLGNTALRFTSSPQAMLLHNAYYAYPYAAFHRFLGVKELLIVSLQRSLFKNDLNKIDLLMCQTETMLRMVNANYRYEKKTTIIPNAVSSDLVRKADNFTGCPVELLSYTNRTKLFYPTAYYKHKNIEFIIDVFSLYHKELDGFVVILTLNAKKDSGAAAILRSIESKGLSHVILNVGEVSQNDLLRYYKCTDILFMPSSLESFSSTYIEAMHFRLPIVASDYDFSREICGDAAIYFAVYDTRSALYALIKAKNQCQLLVNKGVERLKLFSMSWDSVVSKLLLSVEEINSRK